MFTLNHVYLKNVYFKTHTFLTTKNALVLVSTAPRNCRDKQLVRHTPHVSRAGKTKTCPRVAQDAHVARRGGCGQKGQAGSMLRADAEIAGAVAPMLAVIPAATCLDFRAIPALLVLLALPMLGTTAALPCSSSSSRRPLGQLAGQ